MATEVLLMTDVPHLGTQGDVVHVADGYARNYLLPKDMAAPVTKAAQARLVRLKKVRDEELKAMLGDAKKRRKVLGNASCTVKVKTGEDDKLYGSVTATDIVEAMTEQGVAIDRHELMLEAPLKELGVFDVPLKLHPEVTVSVKVWVVEE
jgi:large subunit ribosomal protein L9